MRAIAMAIIGLTIIHHRDMNGTFEGQWEMIYQYFSVLWFCATTATLVEGM